MFYRRKKYKKRKPVQQFKHHLELLVKCFIMIIVPVPIAGAIGLVWYEFFYRNGIHLEQEVEAILSAAWIPIFGILYSLMAAIVVATVWGEYKLMRKAVKRRDLDTFTDLRDETMSPLVHTLIGMLSFFLLVSFMLLNYPTPISGFIVIGSTAYLLTLILFVVIEVDNPCAGLWFIKDIPDEWLTLDVEEYRRQRELGQKENYKGS